MGKVRLGWPLSAPGGVGWIRFRQKGRSDGRLAEGWLAPDGLPAGLAASVCLYLASPVGSLRLLHVAVGSQTARVEAASPLKRSSSLSANS